MCNDLFGTLYFRIIELIILLINFFFKILLKFNPNVWTSFNIWVEYKVSGYPPLNLRTANLSDSFTVALELNINEMISLIIILSSIIIKDSESLRLDAIVAELARCSRNVANEIIENQRVFINYENESRSSKLLSEGDVIVIRGKGKFIVKLINGETRKGKLSVTIEHYI